MLPMEVTTKIHSLCKQVGVEPMFMMIHQEKKTMQDGLRELNKLTEENKHVQLPILVEIIQMNPDFPSVFFKVVEKNPFFSKVYVELLRSIPLELFHLHYENYYESLDTIHVVSSDDYDAYCDNKMVHTGRRSFTLFIVHAIEANVIPIHYYDKTVQKVMVKFKEHMNGDREIMNEIVELLIILKPKGARSLATLNPAEHKGISPKILFRLMELES